MSPFIDLFVIGDGERLLPLVCDEWLRARRSAPDRAEGVGTAGRQAPARLRSEVLWCAVCR